MKAPHDALHSRACKNPLIYLSSILHMHLSISAQNLSHGSSCGCAALAAAQQRYQGIAEDFERRYQRRPAAFARAPGRVNIIGEHIDYEGCALAKWGVCIGAWMA